MKLLIFDTETTGLPKSRKPAYLEANNWPHIVSVSWIITDTDTNSILSKQTHIVKPLSWTIPDASIAIHGITNGQAMAEGKPIVEVMAKFMSLEYDAVLAHNLEFDENVIIQSVLYDCGVWFYGFQCPKYCSMSLTRNICKLPSKFGNSYKPPKLKELYYHVFKKHPDEGQLHGSAYDTQILYEIVSCFKSLREVIGLPTSLTV